MHTPFFKYQNVTNMSLTNLGDMMLFYLEKKWTIPVGFQPT